MKRLTQWIEEDRAIPRVDIRRGGYEKCAMQLARYEDTGLEPDEVMELKERDTAKRVKRDADDIPYCPYCESPNVYYYEENMEYDFCPDCGQRLKWEEL